VGGLTPAELATIRERLEAFADDIFTSLPRTDQRARGQCYLRGLLLDGRRKSIEPMAQRLGEVHDQALHHVVATSPWDWRAVRRRLAEVLCERGELDAALEHATLAVALCRQLPYAQWQVTALAVLAWIRQAHGDEAGAMAAIGEAERVAPSRDAAADMLSSVGVQQARLALAQGRVADAAR
jgi:ATP/maltotriose-dependent transcriptional regulator MalT